MSDTGVSDVREIVIPAPDGRQFRFRYVMIYNDAPPPPSKLSHRKSSWRINGSPKRRDRRLRTKRLVGFVDYGPTKE